MDNKTYQTASYTIPKVENIPLDPERLEIVQKVLEQNQMILDFVLFSPPSNMFLNVNGFEPSDAAKDISERIKNAMR